MTKAKTKLIRGVLTKINSQRLAYKPYSYELSFDGFKATNGELIARPIFVEVEIDAENIVEEGAGFVLLNLQGMTALLSKTADALDELDEGYKRKVGAR